jgi:Na+/H+ antiporter NhaD/arsenite permease-like protein
MNVFGVPAEFFIFGLTLAALASFHRVALPAALTGVAATVAFKLATLGVPGGVHWLGLVLDHEWPGFINLLLILIGFAVLANQFELSAIPDAIPSLLPHSWWGGVVLLGIVFVMSIFLDNIAAAIIGGVMARHVYEGRVGTGYLAAIVAASNAGGAGSVVGDTTTTMMWVNGVSPFVVSRAFIAALVAFAVFAPLAALRQNRICSIRPAAAHTAPIDWARATIVLLLLVTIMATNVLGNAWMREAFHKGPWLGLGLWAAIVVTALWRRPDWKVVPGAASGAVFLVALVALASMMPVDRLPPASWQSTLGLGFLSAVFDNIPLTALALKQGGYDWGMLAYAVGFGGSMVWFGSSAGVALSNLFPDEVRSVGRWVRRGWFIPLAYVAGFFTLFVALGWRPT